MKCKLVAYYRVSTARQGVSGLGLEAQKAAVKAQVASSGCTLIAEYTEIESGRKNDRAELAKAMAHARRAKAKLVIAKMDRLARNVAFTANLMESGVDFVACDMPDANRLTIHIIAAVAEAEAVMISERTKAALAAAKARGVRLGVAGSKNLTREGGLRGSRAGVAAIQAAKAEAYADVAPTIAKCAKAGLSLRQIAAELNADGYTTRSGKPWNPVQVSRCLACD